MDIKKEAITFGITTVAVVVGVFIAGELSKLLAKRA